MSFEIQGKYNTAKVHTNKDREECEQEALDQIQEMVDHEAFVGDDDIAIAPDFHWGAGAVIGFSMPVKNRIVPNTIGVDIGCSIHAVNLGEIGFGDLEELDTAIRERVPTGFDVHDRNDYHMLDDFPWDECKRKLETFSEQTDFDLPDPDSVYTESYLTDLCEKVDYDITRSINSIGSLGGGNHFIELGRDEDDDVWCTIHSGSRGIGAAVAEYWQDRATEHTTTRQSIEDVPDGVREYLSEQWQPRADKIRSDFEGDDIQRKFDEVSQAIQQYGPHSSDRNTDLDYLEAGEASGYIVDMIFAQTYASESRKQMVTGVMDAINSVKGESVEVKDEIESVHNYIDFNDATIRKGACRAHEGERLVVPFNSRDGAIIARGKGKDSWNKSSAHGAGRAMSRTEAKNRFDEEDFSEETEGVFMSKEPLDECPSAYKSAEEIEASLGDNVEVVNRIEPFLSIKAS